MSITLDRGMIERLVRQAIEKRAAPAKTVVNVSARHAHVTQEDLERLFGKGHQLKPMKWLYQDGFFAAEETLTIIGPRLAEHTRQLSDAALRPYVASRIVQIIDPIEDAELFERSGLPGPQNLFEPARAYVHQGRGSYAETADPVRLPALMTRTERGG